MNNDLFSTMESKTIKIIASKYDHPVLWLKENVCQNTKLEKSTNKACWAVLISAYL